MGQLWRLNLGLAQVGVYTWLGLNRAKPETGLPLRGRTTGAKSWFLRIIREGYNSRSFFFSCLFSCS